MQRVGVRHPRQQPRVGGEGDDCEPLDSQVPPERLRIVEEEGVDEAAGPIQQHTWLKFRVDMVKVTG